MRMLQIFLPSGLSCASYQDTGHAESRDGSALLDDQTASGWAEAEDVNRMIIAQAPSTNV